MDVLIRNLLHESPIPSTYIEHVIIAAQIGVGYPNGNKSNFHMRIALYRFNKNHEFGLNW